MIIFAGLVSDFQSAYLYITLSFQPTRIISTRKITKTELKFIYLVLGWL